MSVYTKKRERQEQNHKATSPSLQNTCITTQNQHSSPVILHTKVQTKQNKITKTKTYLDLVEAFSCNSYREQGEDEGSTDNLHLDKIKYINIIIILLGQNL